MAPVTVFLMCAIILGINLFRYYVGVPSNHSLLPFQGGILFRRGRALREVGPGRHRVLLGNEKIVFLDKRPIQVNADNRAVALAGNETLIYGFTASADVGDVKKALYASATYSQLPAFITLCVARGLLNGRDSDQINSGRAALEEEIGSLSRSRLQAVGFELQSFRITQFTVVAAPSESM